MDNGKKTKREKEKKKKSHKELKALIAIMFFFFSPLDNVTTYVSVTLSQRQQRAGYRVPERNGSSEM